MRQWIQNNPRLLAIQATSEIILEGFFWVFFPKILSHSLVSREVLFLKELFKTTLFNHRVGERFDEVLNRYSCKGIMVICSLIL